MITKDPLCPICGAEVENTCHILWQYPSTNDIVGQGDCIRKIRKCSNGEDDFLQIVCELLEKLKNEEFELMATIARRIWFRINKVLFGDLSHLAQLVRSAKEAIDEFMNRNKRRKMIYSVSRTQLYQNGCFPPVV